MSEAQKCFTYLKDNAPKWILELSSLEKHVAEKQKELGQGDAHPADAHPADAVSRPDRNGSIPSIRKQDIAHGHHTIPNGTDGFGASTDDAASPSSSRRRNYLTKRYRPASVLSNLSAPANYRSRNMIIVYYDAEIQKAFEKLVRDIGNGRHLIRKAKMAAQAEAISGSLDDDDLYGMADDAIAPNMKVMNFRRAGSATSPSTRLRTNLYPAFETADKALEKGQSLCERAAHQFLRDGDCRLETENAKEAFQEVFKASSEELARLEQKEKTAEVDNDNAKGDLAPSAPVDAMQKGDPTPETAKPPPGIATIEVDEDEELLPIKMPTLRLTSRMGPRKGLG